MSKTIEQIEQELDAKIPGDSVRERDGGGGRKLSYLEGHYVIDRLNKVFGPLNWDKEITDVRQVVNTTSRGEFPAYLVKVRLSVYHSDGKHSVKEGYGYGADKSSQNAHELAIKEAVTDALKVAAKDLGMSLGLALYSKEQENVDYGQDEEKTSGKSPVEKPAQGAKGSTGSSKDADKLRKLIRAEVSNAIQKGVLDMGKMKEHLTSNYKSDTLDGINGADLEKILTYVKAL